MFLPGGEYEKQAVHSIEYQDGPLESTEFILSSGKCGFWRNLQAKLWNNMSVHGESE